MCQLITDQVHLFPSRVLVRWKIVLMLFLYILMWIKIRQVRGGASTGRNRQDKNLRFLMSKCPPTLHAWQWTCNAHIRSRCKLYVNLMFLAHELTFVWIIIDHPKHWHQTFSNVSWLTCSQPKQHWSKPTISLFCQGNCARSTTMCATNCVRS